MKKINQKSHTLPNTVLGIIVNAMLITSIFLLIQQESNNPESSAIAFSDDIVELDPGNHDPLTYNTISDAITRANYLLTNMNVGDIHTIDPYDSKFCVALIQAYYMGPNTIYWDLEDSTTNVYLEANSGEIVHYLHLGWESGILTKAQIEAQAATIANEFQTLPTDKSSIQSELRSQRTGYAFSSDSGSFSSTSYDYWYCQYDRIKVSIKAEDNIRLVLTRNGNLHSYIKVWTMNLEGFTPDYSVTWSEAEDTALDAVGEGSSIQGTTFPEIVRPNHFWSEDGLQYGLDQIGVWIVWIKDAEDNLYIFQISGTNGEIVGGDYCYHYY